MEEDIKELIYEIRGKRVILASDLAKIYQIETKNINKSVRRNINKFSNENYFQLTKKEYNTIFLRFQNGTLKKDEDNRGNHIKYLPYAFTSDGIRTLETILRKENIKETTIKILKSFEEEKEYEIIDKCPELQTKSIRNKIYEIRGKQVMLDSDLAELYQVETKRINEAVKNNPLKFPERFCFRLTDEESKLFLVEIFDQKKETRGGKFKNPTVFTEQGVAMLATILKSKVATEVSIAIMDTFVLMRRYISNNECLSRISNIETKLIDHDIKIEEVFNRLDSKVYNHIFFEGQIYDAYSLLLDILNKAKESVIIIDNYIDKKLLDVLAKIKVSIMIITSKIKEEDIKKYNEQYHNISLKIDKTFHDRFIIIDNKILYHSGASFKDLGKKCFAISRIENEDILHNLLLKCISKITLK